jgi:hypothetical protein
MLRLVSTDLHERLALTLVLDSTATAGSLLQRTESLPVSGGILSQGTGWGI